MQLENSRRISLIKLTGNTECCFCYKHVPKERWNTSGLCKTDAIDNLVYWKLLSVDLKPQIITGKSSPPLNFINTNLRSSCKTRLSRKLGQSSRGLQNNTETKNYKWEFITKKKHESNFATENSHARNGNDRTVTPWLLLLEGTNKTWWVLLKRENIRSFPVPNAERHSPLKLILASFCHLLRWFAFYRSVSQKLADCRWHLWRVSPPWCNSPSGYPRRLVSTRTVRFFEEEEIC